jgi:hypothetical protein
MTEQSFKKYLYKKDHNSFLLQEDIIGWYLVVYRRQDQLTQSSEDYLFDTLEDALKQAEDQFHIPQSAWKELSDVGH